MLFYSTISTIHGILSTTKRSVVQSYNDKNNCLQTLLQNHCATDYTENNKGGLWTYRFGYFKWLNFTHAMTSRNYEIRKSRGNCSFFWAKFTITAISNLFFSQLITVTVYQTYLNQSDILLIFLVRNGLSISLDF